MSRRVAALAIGVVAGLLLAEAGARWLEPDAPELALAADVGERIPDPHLEYRTAPSSGDNDSRGYRNAEALERADVVALGDSQTWGVNAARDATWPAVLAELTGRSVYNMGRGGYGVVQYRHQLEEALSLEPRWIVIALYLGNDVYDAYSLVYSQEAHEDLRNPDPEARAAIEASDYPDLRRMFFDRLAYGRARTSPVAWLEERSALVRMVARAVREPADPTADRAWAADHPTEGFAYDGLPPTVFHTSYRLAAVDTSLPKIREGLRITHEVLRDIAARVAAARDAQLLVVLLPTKERVYAYAVSSAGVPAPFGFVQSVSYEMRIARGLRTLLGELDVPVLDVQERLQEAIADGEAIFPPNVDGHFNERGYRLIAESIAAMIDPQDR